MRHHVGCVARFSESLRGRPDKGEIPAALDRTAMEAFLNRLAYQESINKISGDARIRACREVRAVLRRVRAMGLPGPVSWPPDWARILPSTAKTSPMKASPPSRSRSPRRDHGPALRPAR